MECKENGFDPLTTHLVVADHVIKEADIPPEEPQYEQVDLFTELCVDGAGKAGEKQALERGKRLQKEGIEIKKHFGK